MGRPQTISSEEIIEAARELFLEKGPSVTTAEIARRAGVSEGTIFKRFPTKRSLFLAAMGMDDRRYWVDELEQMAGEGRIQDNLIQISVRIMEFIRELLPRIMLIWSCKEAAASEWQRMHGPESPPRQALMALARFLEKEMELGRLRRTDSEVAARIFLGSIWNHVFMETIEGSKEQDRMEARVYAHKLVDTVWQGLAPRHEHEGDGET